MTDTDSVAGVLPLAGDACSQLTLLGVVAEKGAAPPDDESWKVCAGGAVSPTM